MQLQDCDVASLFLVGPRCRARLAAPRSICGAGRAGRGVLARIGRAAGAAGCARRPPASDAILPVPLAGARLILGVKRLLLL